MEEPLKRAPKWPFAAAGAFLTFIVLIGIYASDRAQRLQAEERASVSPVVTVTTIAPVQPLGRTPSTAAPGTTASPATTVATTRPAAPATGECTAPNLLQVVRNSGQVDEASARSITVERTVCESGYAYARLNSEVGPVNAYFQSTDGSYKLLALGSSIDPVDYGVPQAIADRFR